jgi:hypothetical protein
MAELIAVVEVHRRAIIPSIFYTSFDFGIEFDAQGLPPGIR